MKVYVMTKFKPFGEEQYVGVKKSKGEAIKEFKKIFPHMRGMIEGGSNTLASDSKNTWLLNIREEEV